MSGRPGPRSHLHMPEDHMDRLYRSANPCVRFVHAGRLVKVAQAVPAAPAGLAVLDAGCGEGHLIEVLLRERPGHACTGVDVTDAALARARARCPGARVLKADLAALPFADASFDVAVCTEVIEHIPDYRAALAELRRVVKPGGRIVVTFPNEPLWTFARLLLGRRPVRVPDHVNSFTPAGLARETGLRVLRQEGLPFPLPFAVSLGWMAVLERA